MIRRRSSEMPVPMLAVGGQSQESRPGGSDSRGRSLSAVEDVRQEGRRSDNGKWRHTLGVLMLLATVVLWTASNFLTSSIFADNEYSKPYFVTYINTSFFVIPLVPVLGRRMYQERVEISSIKLWFHELAKAGYRRVKDSEMDGEGDNLLKPDDDTNPCDGSEIPSSQLLVEDEHGTPQETNRNSVPEGRLPLGEVAKLSLEFSFLWFLANYFVGACLEYTTVASSTILTSTSSIWTLLIGAMIGVERFTLRKLLVVLASLAGIILISSVDISGESDKNRGSFPHKSKKEIAIGDALAFLSAVLYGFYSVLMKKKIENESRVNMPLFFGFVGLFNMLLLWPGFIILHYTGIERFQLPPTNRITAIVMMNSASSLISDYSWAYATLLTSPLLVTVGLSLTIPLSLIGQIILDSQYSSFVYWIGAGIVFLSFIFMNHESKEDELGGGDTENRRRERPITQD